MKEPTFVEVRRWMIPPPHLNQNPMEEAQRGHGTIAAKENAGYLFGFPAWR